MAHAKTRSNKLLKLMFVARAIDGIAGGVERMVTTVMNALTARGHGVDLLTWDQKGATSFYTLVPDVTWHKLDKGDPAVTANHFLKLSRAKTIRTLMRRRKPNAIVCFQDGPFIAIRGYTIGMGIPVFAAERNAPTRFDHTTAAQGPNLSFNAMRFSARVLIQCESYRALYPPFLHDKITTIPNPVFPAELHSRPEVPNTQGRFRVLSVARLSYQKNPATLLHSFSSLASRFPEWDLVLVGEGEDRTALQRIIDEKGLAARVSLAGATKSVSEWYAASHLFCLSSRWEGFPNAMAEAMAHGLPCVGFAGCAGVRDLIAHGENGLLAAGNDDPQSLTKVLSTLMASGEKRRRLGQKAVDSMAPYAPEKIFGLWEQTLMEGCSR